MEACSNSFIELSIAEQADDKIQQMAEELNSAGFGKYSGTSFSVLNGRVVERQNEYNYKGPSDWQTLFGRPAGPYKPDSKPQNPPKEKIGTLQI